MYKLKYDNLLPAQIKKLKKMVIPNKDEKTDEKKWEKNCQNRLKSDIKTAEKAIGIFLHGPS